MTKAIIHVGMDKTGTTFLQERFALLRDRLAASGVAYPTPKGPTTTHHVDFAAAHGFSWNYNATDDGSRNAWSTMADDLPGQPSKLFLSSEHFCYNVNPRTVGRLKVWLTSNGFDDVEIIIFVRDQVGWLISAYGEYIKWGGKDDMTTFYHDRTDRFLYGAMIDVWAGMFDERKIKLVNYDVARRTDPENGIVGAIWDAIGVTQGQRDSLDVTEQIFSNSLSSQILLEWLRACDVGLSEPQYQEFSSIVLSNVTVTASRPLLNAKIWKLPEAFKQELPNMAKANAELSARFAMTPIRDVVSEADGYERKVASMSLAAVSQAAMMIILEAALHR